MKSMKTEIEKDEVCIFCARWHPGIRYAPLVDAWLGEQCLLKVIERNPHDDVARLVAEELGLNFSEDPHGENICDFCGESDAIILDEVEEKRICQECWNKIKL